MGKLLTRSLLIIDESFQLYRSHFVSFTSLAALYVVPVIAIILGLMLAFSNSSSGSILFNVLGALVLIWLFGIYNVSSISKAALLATKGQRPSLLQALNIRPTRLLGVVFFSGINYIIINIFVSVLFLPLSLLLMFISVFIGVLMSATRDVTGGSSITNSIAAFFSGLTFFATTALSFISGVACIILLIYSLQGLIHHPTNFSDRINRTFAIVFFNFGRNILVSMISASIIIILSLAIGITVSIVLYYPIELLNIARLDTAEILVLASLSLASVLLLPIIPIIAAMLYQHNSYEYDAEELNERLERLLFARQTEANLGQGV